MKQALYYEKTGEQTVRCYLCPHHCRLSNGGLGACRARKNMGGELYSLNYARIASIALDPIEKKPLANFHPGSQILSVGTFGCNFKCGWCQNWTIAYGIDESQKQQNTDWQNPERQSTEQQVRDISTTEMQPQELADLAVQAANKGSIGVAYTYNEPSIWYEYVLDSATLVHEKGLVNVLVTNGYISEEPLQELLPYIDAMNIDVKGFTEGFYEKYCAGSLADVKRTVEIASKSCHVEVTTLIIPGINDSAEEIGELSRWLASVSPDIVLHLSRFFPNYQLMDIPPTPKETLLSARLVAEKYLHRVRLGNI